MTTNIKYNKEEDELAFKHDSMDLMIDSNGDLFIEGFDTFLSITIMREIIKIHENKGKYSDV